MPARPFRYLLATVQLGGNVYPELGLARRLVAHGHHVHVLSEPSVRSEARAAGCSFTAWPTAPAGNAIDRDAAAAKDWQVKSPRQAVRYVRGVGDFFFGGAGLFARDLLTVLQELSVDAVLADFTLIGALSGAQRSGLPTAALMPSIYVRPTRGHPVLGSGWLPCGPTTRVRDTLAPMALERLFDLGLPRLNAARSQLGLPPLPHVLDVLDRCARVLVMTSPTFDPPPRRLPANVRYVGPVLDDPAWAASASAAEPAGSDPLVLVAMSSTYQQHQRVLQRIVDALDAMPVRAVVTLGPGLREGEVSGTPRVAVVPAAPHGALLPRAAAVVTHAGHGSVIKALAAGVPMVCVPHGRDQADNAARVVRLGAGVRLSRRADVAAIQAAVRRVAGEPAYRAAAHRVARNLAEEASTGADAVVQIEGLAAPR